MESCELQRRFLLKLRQIGVDVDRLGDPTFDNVFDCGSTEIKTWISWFCDNISPDNVLSQEEVAEYSEISKLGLLVSEEEVESRIAECQPSFYDLQNFCVKDDEFHKNEIDELQSEMEELSDVFISLQMEEKEAKQRLNSTLGSLNKCKVTLSSCKDELLLVNCDWNFIESDVVKAANEVVSCSEDVDIFTTCMKPLSGRLYSSHVKCLVDKIHSHKQKLASLPKYEATLAMSHLQDIITYQEMEAVKDENKLWEMVINEDKSDDGRVVSAEDVSGLSDSIQTLQTQCLAKCAGQAAKHTLHTTLQAHCTHHHNLQSALANTLCEYQRMLKKQWTMNKVAEHVFVYTHKCLSAHNTVLTALRDALQQDMKLMSGVKLKLMSDVKLEHHSCQQQVPLRDHPIVNFVRDLLQLDPTKSCGVVLAELTSIRTECALVEMWKPQLHANTCSIVDFEKILKLSRAKLESGPTLMVPLTPPDVHQALLDCSAVKTKLREDLDKLGQGFVRCKERLQEDREREVKLLWCCYLVEPKKALMRLTELRTKLLHMERKSQNL